MDHQPFFDVVGVDAFRAAASKPASSSSSSASSLGRPAVAGHLGAARAGADGQRHLRLRAEEAEEGAVERGLIARRRGGGVLLEHRVRRRFALDPLDVADREAVLLQQGDRDVELVAGDARAPRCVVSRVRAKPSRRPISTAARDQQPDRRRRLRSSSSGSLLAAGLLRRRDDRRQRREGGGAAGAGARVLERGVERGDEGVGALEALARLLLQRPHHHRVERG